MAIDVHRASQSMLRQKKAIARRASMLVLISCMTLWKYRVVMPRDVSAWKLMGSNAVFPLLLETGKIDHHAENG